MVFQAKRRSFGVSPGSPQPGSGAGPSVPHGDVREGPTYLVGDPGGAQALDADAAAVVHEAGDRVGQDGAGVAQQPAQVAGVVGTLAQLQAEREVHGAAGAEEDGGAVRRDARAVGADEQIRGQQPAALQLAELGEAGGPELLTGLQQKHDVVSERPLPLPDDMLQGDEVDQVLPLVVGDPAPVPALALDGEPPGIEPGAPSVGVPRLYVRVAVGEERGQALGLGAAGDQEGVAGGDGVLRDVDGEPHAVEAGRDLLGQVAAQLGFLARVVALGGDRDEAGEFFPERPGVEVVCGAVDRVLSAHGPRRWHRTEGANKGWWDVRR